MRWLTRALLLALLATGGCDDDGGTPSCPGSPGMDCETVVGSLAECPAWETVCAGICGPAAYDCCFCENGTWQSSPIDCALCDAAPAPTPDAAPPDAAMPDAG